MPRCGGEKRLVTHPHHQLRALVANCGRQSHYEGGLVCGTLLALKRVGARVDALTPGGKPLEPKKTQPNEGEGNKTAARQYNAAAKEHAESTDTEAIARDAAGELDQLVEQLRNFDVGMLVTEREDGRLAARPMYVADQADDGTIRFVTSRDAAVVEEIEEEPSVAVTFQAGKRYLSMTAHAEVLDQPGALQSIWKESFRLWFPEGPTSPNAVVLKLAPQEAEYWDETGVQSIRLFVQAAVSYFKGESLQGKNIGKHASVELGSHRRP